MFDEDGKTKRVKVLKKITKQCLKNIGLYYLKRYESSVENLKQVLIRRVNDYAYQNSEFNKSEAYDWIEEIVNDFVGYDYVNDERFTEIRVRDYINAGKSTRYIRGKLREKGISEVLAAKVLDNQEYDEFETALKLARKKHIGPFRQVEDDRFENRQKDMGTLVRAGFNYDTVLQVLDYQPEE